MLPAVSAAAIALLDKAATTPKLVKTRLAAIEIFIHSP
ncbi:hypothetical protein HCMG_00908 [Helicobacter canadensis MIT 98-5491]|nr:hypothetical protein HCMG_00908 [Helicobacter canadensis MIT 98-5491]